MSKPEATPPLIDNISYETAEIDRLKAAVPVQTDTGSRVLDAQMRGGLSDVDAIKHQQEAVWELLDVNHAELREVLKGGLKAYAQNSRHMEAFVGGADSQRSYEGMTKAASSLKKLIEDSRSKRTFPLRSPLVQELLQTTGDFNDTAAADLMRGVYYTPVGLRGRDHSAIGSRLRFYPAMSPRALGYMGVFIAAAAGVVPQDAMYPVMPMLGVNVYGSLSGGASGTVIKDTAWNAGRVYGPLRRQIKSSDHYDQAIQAVGRLDTLLALGDFYTALKDNGHEAELPSMRTADVYEFEASDLKNPLLAAQAGRTVVGNAIHLGGEDRLTFLTGPNSGGKSTLSKAIVQSQVLAQAGGPIAARQSEITLADRIAYHVPTPPDLSDESGRFHH